MVEGDINLGSVTLGDTRKDCGVSDDIPNIRYCIGIGIGWHLDSHWLRWKEAPSPQHPRRWRGRSNHRDWRVGRHGRSHWWNCRRP